MAQHTRKPKASEPEKKYPAFLETQKLREVHRAAEVYLQATGNQCLYNALTVALEEAERWEDPSTYNTCRNCGCRIPKNRRYCGLDCAETDGAIPPK
jgi:hypothetical protein